MKTRVGKIAQLPKQIRHELNQRLENGKQSPELLKWLNALPETQELLADKFDHQPITKSNLSDWRQGGFQDWLADQAREARIQRISESGASLEQAETGDLFENFARIAVAELMADFDSLQKHRGEDRSLNLHNLVRDLSRLQNSFNRSRWADLAWTKYNDSLPTCDDTAKPDPGIASLSARTVPPASCAQATPSPSTSVVPDGTQSQAGHPHDSIPPKPEAIRPGSGLDVIHHTRCECGGPCPKCHAPESDYPLDEALRDKQFYEKHRRQPHDRHGIPKFLINVECDCFCDRCAPVTQAFQPAGSGNFPVPGPQLPKINTNPPTPLSPLSSSRPLTPLTDFSRRMALLKSANQ